MSLLSWGWKENEPAVCEPDSCLGRVVAIFGEEYRIGAEEGEVNAALSGRLRYSCDSPADLPAVGDWVEVRGQLITRVLPRKNAICRKAAGSGRSQQVLAANVDILFIVTGLDQDLNPRRLERYLVIAAESGVRSAILLNKADLCPDIARVIEAVRAIAAGREVLVASALAREGVEQIRERLETGGTGALIGSSGAGKSTLINCLLGEDAQAVREVREHDSRGRHTTTHRQLFRLPGGGLLMDHPGLREIQLWAANESVAAVFPEIEALARECRFRDCRHQGEPGCAIASAVDEGGLDPARLNSFHKLAREARHLEIESDPLAAAARKREIKLIHKSMRGRNRD